MRRRIERRLKMDDNMKVLLKKLKQRGKKSFDKIKQLEILLVKFKSANNPRKIQSELKELNKIQVIDKNLHEIKNEILLDYNGEIEIVGSLKVGDQIKENHIRF